MASPAGTQPAERFEAMGFTQQAAETRTAAAVRS
jgi:hypothetical protein